VKALEMNGGQQLGTDGVEKPIHFQQVAIMQNQTIPVHTPVHHNGCYFKGAQRLDMSFFGS
jgi:hypothetical protein